MNRQPQMDAAIGRRLSLPAAGGVRWSTVATWVPEKRCVVSVGLAAVDRDKTRRSKNSVLGLWARAGECSPLEEGESSREEEVSR